MGIPYYPGQYWNSVLYRCGRDWSRWSLGAGVVFVVVVVVD